MKKIVTFLFCVAVVLPAFMLPAAAAAAPAREGGAVFGRVEGREWILEEVSAGGKTVRMDRSKLAADNMAGVYTVSFRDNQVSGMGAPNRYTGPYTAGTNRRLTLGNLVSTKMAAFREPDGLKESEYFSCLSKVIRWDLNGEKLELYSVDGGTETVLVFSAN